MMRHAGRPVRIASGINLLLGLLLAASPWLLGYAALEPDLAWGSALVGSLIALGGAARVCWPRQTSALSGANAVFGAWTVIAPHVYAHSPALPLLYFHLALGSVVACCGAFSIGATLAWQRREA